MITVTKVWGVVTTSLLIDRMLQFIACGPQQLGIMGVRLGVFSLTEKWYFSLEAQPYIYPPVVDINS